MQPRDDADDDDEPIERKSHRELSMKGDLKAIQWVDQSDQEATANEMAKHGEAEDIGLPNKEALRKTSSQRTSSATVIPFRTPWRRAASA